MSELNLSQALALVESALAASRAHGFRPMSIVVVDGANRPLVSVREEAATELRTQIALGKASAALGMGCSTRQLAKRAQEMPVFFASIAATAKPAFIAQTGGLLVVDAEGHVLGAVGASGGSGDEDEAILLAGIAGIGLGYR
ncbi:GlcG/HbpS family heme-binding protein [Pseudomonas promysalinigenes]|uniref:GlcG/HbpS family heme-binding protein n=1 Tax=Pseudomonas promysalinigenes TaxID=485898 RepID=UPI00272158E9